MNEHENARRMVGCLSCLRSYEMAIVTVDGARKTQLTCHEWDASHRLMTSVYVCRCDTLPCVIVGDHMRDCPHCSASRWLLVSQGAWHDEARELRSSRSVAAPWADQAWREQAQEPYEQLRDVLCASCDRVYFTVLRTSYGAWVVITIGSDNLKYRDQTIATHPQTPQLPHCHQCQPEQWELTRTQEPPGTPTPTTYPLDHTPSDYQRYAKYTRGERLLIDLEW